MRKQHIYLLVGIAWLSCCIYQLKNSNMFMVVVSAIISVLFLLWLKCTPLKLYLGYFIHIKKSQKGGTGMEL